MVYVEVIVTGDIQIAGEGYSVASVGESNRAASRTAEVEEKHAVDVGIADDGSTQDGDIYRYFFRPRRARKHAAESRLKRMDDKFMCLVFLAFEMDAHQSYWNFQIGHRISGLTRQASIGSRHDLAGASRLGRHCARSGTDTDGSLISVGSR